MVSRALLVLAAVLLACALYVSAAAAKPKKHHKHHGISPENGRTYSGTFLGNSPGVKKVLNLKVSANGRSGDASLSCNGTPSAGGHIHMLIVDGAFSGKHVTHGLVSSLELWNIKGHFTSKTQAKAYVGLPDNCDGHSGGVTLTVR